MEIHPTESQPAAVISREALLQSHKLKVVQSQVALALEESAIDICLQGVHTHKQLKDVAAYVKKELDKKHLLPVGNTGVFHCICGQSFASAISYRTGFYIHLRIDSIQILIFKSLDNARDL